MDPFDVLGISPSASSEAIETRYRLLVREYHPDLHHHRGPEALAQAEQMTQRINAAMDLIRSGYTRTTRPRGESGTYAGGFTTEQPWGHGHWSDDGVDQPVPCPFCAVGFTRLADYELHLRIVHRLSNAPAPASRPSPFMEQVGKLRYIPAWLVLALGFVLWATLGWSFFLADMVFLIAVLWAQTSPRFRQQRQWNVLR